jgi:hypothetical protein
MAEAGERKDGGRPKAWHEEKKKRIVARVSPAMEKKSLSDDRVGCGQLVPEASSARPHLEKRHVVTGSGDRSVLALQLEYPYSPVHTTWNNDSGRKYENKNTVDMFIPIHEK